MKWFTLSILFFIGLTATWPIAIAPLHAETPFLTKEQMSRVREATELAYNDKLIESFVRFESLHQEIPENPLGYFYMIAVLEKIQTDYFCDYRQKKLRDLLKQGEKVGERYVRINPNEALGHFFLGGMQGYYGLHYYRSEGRLTVFRTGLKAVRHLKRAVQLKVGLWDAYYGLGIYYYYKSEKAPFLYFLGHGRQADKEKGIQYLNHASNRGIYGQAEAIGALVRVLHYEERYDEALNWSNRQVSQYPQSAHNHRMRMRTLAELNLFEDVLDDCTKLRAILQSKPYTGDGAWVQLDYNTALALYHLERYFDAEHYIQKCLNLYRKSRPKIHFDERLPKRANKLSSAIREKTKSS